MADDLERFAVRLRQAAEKHRPQERAADMAGVSVPAWQRYLSGRNEPSFLAIARFARAAGVSLDWLAYGREAAVFDEALLVQVILGVELFIADVQLPVPPTSERKARLIAYLYGEILRDAAAGGGGNVPVVEPEKIRRLFALLT